MMTTTIKDEWGDCKKNDIHGDPNVFGLYERKIYNVCVYVCVFACVQYHSFLIHYHYHPLSAITSIYILSN